MTVLVPSDLDTALAALATNPDALVLAGGTDLMVGINAGEHRFDSVLALRRVSELHDVVVDEPGLVVRIGAGVTYTRLLDADVVAHAPALAQAARTVGSPQIRNAGTIGGNVGTASPAGDTLPVLVALGATVELASSDGRRSLPIEAFVTGAKRTAIAPGELITAVLVPIVRGGQEYRKVGVRNAMVIAVASVALALDAVEATVRVGLGSVGPVPLRAHDAEAWIASRLAWGADGAELAASDDATKFGQMVAAAARPIDDHRSTADYRRHAIGVLAARCLRNLTT
ncbi:MAG: FAD binding domain-containing protein [Acidimicrobiales bacterium]